MEKCTIDEIIERMSKVMYELARRSHSEFVIECNHVLGSDYTTDNIEWED